jgi:uncharacterized protein YhfF
VSDSCAELWRAFLASGAPAAESAAGATHTSWQFGLGAEQADRLLALVLSGGKRATAGSLWTYEHDGDQIPAPGDFSIILDGRGVGRCVVRTTSVQVVAFGDVDEAFAHDEGEGDRSLTYWRDVHWAYFTRELAAFGRTPALDMPLVCERFEVVFTADVGFWAKRGESI